MPKAEPTVLLRKAEQAVESGKIKTAIKAYGDYVESVGSRDIDLIEKIGDLCESAGDDFRAIDYYRSALQIEPRANVSLKLAQIQNKLLCHEDALEVLNEALSVHPGNEVLLVEKLYAQNEMCSQGECHYSELLRTANQLLAINADSVAALCFRARALLNGKQPKLEEAGRDLDKALKLQPDEPLANYYLALLNIEKADFDRAMALFDDAYSGFKKRKLETWASEVCSQREYYRERTSDAKRTTKFRGTTFEQQLATFVDCGLVFDEQMLQAALPKLKEASGLYEKEPYQTLLFNLVAYEGLNVGLVKNALNFDTECIYNTGDYVWIADMMSQIALGDLNLSEVTDHVYGEDSHPVTGKPVGQAWLAFAFAGQQYKWAAKYDNDWVDTSILSRFSALLKKSGSEKRFACIDTRGQDALILCLPLSKLNQFEDRTGIQVELLE